MLLKMMFFTLDCSTYLVSVERPSGEQKPLINSLISYRKAIVRERAGFQLKGRQAHRKRIFRAYTN